jgi:hypothetical protein
MKEQELKYYKQFADFLQKYEDVNEKCHNAAHGVPQVRLISGESKSHLKNKLEELSVGLKNPFLHVRNWIKSEIWNLQSLMNAISEKEACSARKQKAIKKLNE